MNKKFMLTVLACTAMLVKAQEPVDYVNPFIGTSNYGTTNPIYIKNIKAGGKDLKGYTISQEELVNAGTLEFILNVSHK
ncbi:MAG: hypothetical protein LUG96_02030 [Tannerellaceae bacterium]|nr:hypothetical protein [Tannerellaceae bacterium]